MILALDLGTKCGWAALHDDDTVRSGVWHIAADNGQAPGWRWLHLQHQLLKLNVDARVELVAFERSMAMRGGHAVEVYAGLKAVVELWCATRGIRCESVHQSTLKKWATGSGRADKAQMAEAASRMWPTEIITSDDQADALCILGWALEQTKKGSEP